MPNSGKVRDCSWVLKEPPLLYSDKVWGFSSCLTHPGYRTARVGIVFFGNCTVFSILVFS